MFDFILGKALISAKQSDFKPETPALIIFSQERTNDLMMIMKLEVFP